MTFHIQKHYQGFSTNNSFSFSIARGPPPLLLMLLFHFPAVNLKSLMLCEKEEEDINT